MDNKPDSNLSDKKEEIDPTGYTVAGDHNVIYGNVGPGSVVGRGTVQAHNIAGNDINHNGKNAVEQAKQFTDLMLKLKNLILEAHKSGELNERVAQKALRSLAETADMITKEEKPPKSQILRRLQYVADVLDTAVDLFASASSGGVAKTLLQALPVVALLIKIAGRIF